MTDQPDLKARVEELAEYAQHKGGCDALRFSVKQPPGCSCGRDDAVAALLSRITELEAERDEALIEPWGHESGEPWRGKPPTARRLAECIGELATTDRMGLEQRIANIIRRDRVTTRRRWEGQNVRADVVEARAQAAKSRLALAEKVVEACGPFLVIANHPAALGEQFVNAAFRPEDLRALSAALAAYDAALGEGSLAAQSQPKTTPKSADTPSEPSATWRLGQQVAIRSTYVYAADWRDATLYICGIEAKPRTGETLLSVSEHWPPSGLGDVTTDFPEDALAPAIPNVRDGLSGRYGAALGALREIANDMPGVRAVHKRTAMRHRAISALCEGIAPFAAQDISGVSDEVPGMPETPSLGASS